MKKIILFRHGETNLNVADITMGQNLSLHTFFTSKGFKEINEVGQKLIDRNVEVIFSSDLERAYDTAKYAVKGNSIPIYTSKLLRGLNMGSYQGLRMDELYKSEVAKKCFNNHDLKFPDGESINDLNNRIKNFIIDIASTTNYQNIAIVSHSAVISNLKSYLTGDKYESLSECTIAYDDSGNLKVLSYIKAGEKNILNGHNFILVRHGENLNDELLSNDLLPLSDLGKRQAFSLKNKLQDRFDIVISSVSKRAIDTAKIIAPNYDIVCDERLLERGYGNEMHDGSETDFEAKERVKAFLEELVNKYPNQRILIVSHGSLIKIMQDVIEDVELTRDKVDNCDAFEYTKEKEKIIIKNQIKN